MHINLAPTFTVLGDGKYRLEMNLELTVDQLHKIGGYLSNFSELEVPKNAGTLYNLFFYTRLRWYHRIWNRLTKWVK